MPFGRLKGMGPSKSAKVLVPAKHENVMAADAVALASMAEARYLNKEKT